VKSAALKFLSGSACILKKEVFNLQAFGAHSTAESQPHRNIF
jgi:hypothetical protein